MDKYYYKIYGLTLTSDYEFPQFLSLEDIPAVTDIEIEHGGISERILSLVADGAYTQIKDDEMWFKNSVGIFWIHDQRKISFLEHKDVSVDDAAAFLPGMCLSILLRYRNMLMIHGACIRLNGKTVVISGNSGAGKSTLTTELIKRGAKLMADDVTGVADENGIYVSYPAFPAQKLCSDQIEKNEIDTTDLRQISYDLNKYEIPRFEEFHNIPEKVDVFFRVEVRDVTELTKEEVIGAEKVKILTDSMFLRWLFNESFRFRPEDMVRCIGLAKQIKMYRIQRNKTQDTLQEILSYIENNI